MLIDEDDGLVVEPDGCSSVGRVDGDDLAGEVERREFLPRRRGRGEPRAGAELPTLPILLVFRLLFPGAALCHV